MELKILKYLKTEHPDITWVFCFKYNYLSFMIFLTIVPVSPVILTL